MSLKAVPRRLHHGRERAGVRLRRLDAAGLPFAGRRGERPDVGRWRRCSSGVGLLVYEGFFLKKLKNVSYL